MTTHTSTLLDGPSTASYVLSSNETDTGTSVVKGMVDGDNAHAIKSSTSVTIIIRIV